MARMRDNETISGYLNALLSGNRKEAEKICDHFLASGTSIKDLYELVIKPALYEVGLLWEKNRISVADEHLATAISEGILNALYSRIIPDHSNGKKVVLACVEGESHQVGIKMVADVFEMHGWESYVIGRGIPLQELLNYIASLQPRMLAISLSIYFNYVKFLNMTKAVQDQFPGLPVLAGGQAFLHLDHDIFADHGKMQYISDLYALDNYLTKLNDT